MPEISPPVKNTGERFRIRVKILEGCVSTLVRCLHGDERDLNEVTLMTRWSHYFALFVFLSGIPAGAAEAPGSIQFGRFGTIPIVHPQGEPSQVVLLLSGDKGLGEVEAKMASVLARQGALVFEIDSARYLQATGQIHCIFPGADFEAVSQFGQARLGLATYKPSILVGTGAGAELAYAALAQAPPGTFTGAVSTGFCEVLDSQRPLCQGTGLMRDHTWKKG